MTSVTFGNNNILSLSNGGIGLRATSVQSIVAGTGISAAMIAPIIRVQGDGGAVTISATPNIVAGEDSQIIIIQGYNDTNTVTFQDEGTLPSSALKLNGAANCVLGLGDILVLLYDGGDNKYYEITRSNN